MIFGTDGIRGFPHKGLLTEQGLLTIGLSIGKLISKNNSEIKNIFIASDTRSSTTFIKNNLKKGLNTFGIGTTDLGILPTSSVSIMCNKYPKSYGLVITASHNNSEYNGIKIFNNVGEKIDDNDQKTISNFYDYFIKRKIKTRINNKINIKYPNSIDEYSDFILGKFIKRSSFKIGIDLANGSSYKATKMIMSKTNNKCFYIGDKPNGENINSDFGVENTKRLRQLIINKSLDFGVAFDGDADRVVFIDNIGRQVDGDKILDFLSSKLLKKSDKFVTTIMTNNAIDNNLSKKGIKVIKTDVGDRNVYQSMVKNKSNFGGENSGHYIFKNILNTSDSNLTLLLICNVIKNAKDFHKIYNRKMNPSILKSYTVLKKEDLKKISSISTFKRNFKNKNKDYYLNIRYSGTENKIRILIQGKDKVIIEEYIKEFSELVKKL